MANCAIEEQKTYDPPLIAFCTPFEQFPCFGQEEVLRYRNDDTLGSSNDIDVQDIMKKRPTLTLNPNNQSSSSIVAVTNKQNLSKINACNSPQLYRLLNRQNHLRVSGPRNPPALLHQRHGHPHNLTDLKHDLKGPGDGLEPHRRGLRPPLTNLVRNRHHPQRHPQNR